MATVMAMVMATEIMKIHNLTKIKFENEISSNNSKYGFSLFKDLKEYRFLIWLFIKRDFIAYYKQTILGPIWFFVQPVFTTIIFTVIFGNLAGISTGGVPKPLFYLSGLVLWNFFADCLNLTSDTFKTNQNIFGKVFFPRIIVPLSIVVSNMAKMVIQFLLFITFYFYFKIFEKTLIYVDISILLIPILILLMGLLGLSFGILITSLTTKYRDLKFLIQFGVQLLMYASPIIYPVNTLTGNLKTMVLLNPVTSIIETFKYGFFSQGTLNYYYLLYSILFTLVLLIISLRVFARVEKNFIDTI